MARAPLFQESAQYIDPMALFDAAHRLLCDGPATLVVMDEFALKREADTHVGLHQLDHFCALAARMGWRLVQRTELSDRAAPTLEYLATHTRALQKQLIAELNVTPEQLDQLDASNRRYRQQYGDGVYGYALLRFERDGKPAERLVQVTSERAGAACALFGEIFGHPMSSAHWSWKYGGGRGSAIGLMRGDAMVAHYGGVSRPVVYLGSPAMACQICDVMVSPHAKTGLHRRGPIYQVTASFVEQEIGWAQPHRVGFGFPSERAFGVAQRQGLYEAVDSVVRANWPTAELRGRPSCRAEAVGQQGHALGAKQRLCIHRLWQRMAADLKHTIVGVRDAAWIEHRYLMHPTLRYEVQLLRRPWTRRLVGLMVTRTRERHLEVIDMVAAPADFGELITLARHQAAAAGLERVDCWITQSQLHCLEGIDAAAFAMAPLNITVPANAHTPGPVAELRERWFLLAGDADFT